MVMFLIGFFMILSAESPSLGEVIGPELRAVLESVEPEKEIAFVVTLLDQIELKDFEDEDEKVRGSEIVKALKQKAESTQESIKAFLMSRGAKRIHSLWIINGIAVTARADVIHELAIQPGIKSIQLDKTLNLP